MADPIDESAARSRKIKDHALKILRETRAKIDPHLLSAMKERFSSMAPGMMPDKDMPLSSKGAAADKPPVDAGPKTSAKGAAAVYSQTAKIQEAPAPAEKEEQSKTEPVDRQKVAQIVMEYMKLREGSKTKH